MIGSYAPFFIDELVKRVTEAKINRAVGLATGSADYPTYKYECGLMAGLDLALEIADEIKRDIDKA
jgi:hypothetical protein